MDELQKSARASDVAAAFLDQVCGILNPPAHSDAAAYVRQLANRLDGFSSDVLALTAATVLAERKRDLPAVPDIVALAKVAERSLEVRARQTAAAEEAPPVQAPDPAAAARLPDLREALGGFVGGDVMQNWFASLQLEAVEQGHLRVSVFPKFIANWTRTHYADELRRAAASVFPNVTSVDVVARRAAQ